MANASNFEDLTGKLFGRLTVTGRGSSSADNRTRWDCLCICGNVCLVRAKTLKSGDTRSCGCLSDESRKTTTLKHGHSGVAGKRTSTYSSWVSMKTRCLNSGDPSYKDYGGRGITICPAWVDSFDNFISDMGERPGGTTLERVKNLEHYTPDNCRWATKKEQANNRRSSKLLEFAGKTQTLSTWCDELDLKYDTVQMRLQSGWSIQRALTTKTKGGRV